MHVSTYSNTCCGCLEEQRVLAVSGTIGGTGFCAVQICFAALLEVNNRNSWLYLPFLFYINCNLFLAYVLFLFALMILMITVLTNIHDSTSDAASYHEAHSPLLIHSLCSCERWNIFGGFFWVAELKDHFEEILHCWESCE